MDSVVISDIRFLRFCYDAVEFPNTVIKKEENKYFNTNKQKVYIINSKREEQISVNERREKI